MMRYDSSRVRKFYIIRKYDYVIYKDDVYVVTDTNGDIITIAGLYPLYNLKSFCAIEFDVPIQCIKPYTGSRIVGGLLSKLRIHIMTHDNIFDFADEELTYIHTA